MGGLGNSFLLVAALGPALTAAAPPVPGGPPRLQITGGSQDDESFARLAAGLPADREAEPEELERALAAIRATDRFRTVTGELWEGVCRVRLEPWPALESWTWTGDCPKALRKRLIPELREGIRPGEVRLEGWRSRGEAFLRSSGYPQARLSLVREEGGRHLVIRVEPGAPARIREIRITGSHPAYSEGKLLKLMGLKAGSSLWREDTERQLRSRLRTRFLKDRRYEWKVTVTYEAATGLLSIPVDPGPLVRVHIQGSGLGWSRPKDLLPLTRAESYSPELLAEGERRILRLLRARGYLDAQVTSSQGADPGHPGDLRVDYRLQSGPRYRLRGLRFENQEGSVPPDLKGSLSTPRRWYLFGEPLLTPDLIGGLEDQIKGYYSLRGYPDFRLRRPPMESEGDQATLVFQLREGRPRAIRRLELHLGAAWSAAALRLAESLTASFADQPMPVKGGAAGERLYRSDRSQLAKVTAVLRPIPGVPPAYALDFSTPVPLVKRDLAQVLYLLHQELISLGVQRPQEKLSVSEGEDGAVVRIDLPDQPTEKVQRLVVRGADRTRARAFLRESRLAPGAPLDPERLVGTQAGVANLGAFNHVELHSLSDSPGAGEGWKPGDLAMDVSERSPWVVTNAFSYDRAQGYQIGTGIQRLNVGGMGRTLDLGLRAGDGTLNSPWLRKVFPTGDSPRSVDMYSLAYTDPWFAPWSWLPDRARLRDEGAYILERKDAYEIRRQRVLNGIEWHVGDHLLFQAGHRFEQVRVRLRPEIDAPSVSDELLNQITHSPSHSIISAPYLQVVRDTRDNPFDPTRGTYSLGRIELATQFLGTSPNSSFIKLDLRHQWTWSVGERASAGVLMLGLRVGMARPTASSAEDLPLSERFFGGGPFSQRGVEPDELGPVTNVDMLTANGSTVTKLVALGGQGLVVANGEYRFPVLRPTLWGEVFVDSGQVYSRLSDKHHDPLRTSVGIGTILKVGFPIKIEYAVDVKRLLGRPRSQEEIETQLKNLLISAGFQF
nr:BamA/TamA family outer membrane protein [uncultured Holophaga sp.]